MNYPNAYIEDFPNVLSYKLNAGASNPKVGGNAAIRTDTTLFAR